MSISKIGKEPAEEFVTALYNFILKRRSISDDELKYWSNEVIEGRPLGEVVQLFLGSEEYKLANAESTVRTKFPNGHFYSPVVDPDTLHETSDVIFSDKPVLGVDLNAVKQIEMLSRIVSYHGSMPFRDEKRDSLRYYYNNSSYGFGDALAYWGMIAHFRPKRIVEIGCGFTSALALDAIDHFKLQTSCVFVDPFPQLLHDVASPIDSRHKVFERKVQNVDLEFLSELEEGDFLFIDSSHVVKTGSDVHFEIFEMLPRLRPGVIVHFHDLFYPFEYPRTWVLEDNHSWNEIYFVYAFLMYNSAFEIIFFNDYLKKKHSDSLRRALPADVAERVVLNPGGGLWLVKV